MINSIANVYDIHKNNIGLKLVLKVVKIARIHSITHSPLLIREYNFYYVLRCTQEPVKHLNGDFLQKIVNGI